MMKFWTIAVCLLFASPVTAASSLYGEAAKKITKTWNEDLDKIKPRLPKLWKKLHSVSFYTHNQTKELISQLRPKIPKNKKGKYRLQITLDMWHEKNELYTLVIYQVFTRKNKIVWELSRTFTTHFFTNPLIISKSKKKNTKASL